MKVGDAEAVDFRAAVAAAFTRTDHDGVAVLLPAQIQVDVAGVDLRRRVRAVVRPKNQIAGLQGCKDGILRLAGGRWYIGQAFQLFEPEILVMSAARRVASCELEEEGDGSGTIHAFGVGSAGDIGHGWILFVKVERLLQQGLPGGVETVRPDGNRIGQ